MRVAFFVKRFPCVSETFILRQITGLLELGHDVRIFSHLPPDGAPLHDAVERFHLLERTRWVDSRPPRPAVVAGWALAAAPALARHPAALSLLRRELAAPLGGRLAVLPRLRVLADGGGFDVVHCHFGDVALWYGFAAEHWDAPLVVSFYGGYDVTRIPRAQGADVYAGLFRDCAAVTALGERMAAEIRDLGCPPEKIRQVPLAVDTSEFVAGPRAAAGTSTDGGAPVRLLSVARLVEMKGIEYALRALAAVREAEPARPLRYDVVGGGPLRAELEALAGELGLAGVVEFHGALAQPDVRRLMSAADVFLLPSVTTASGDQEGTPTVLMEASSSEVAVVSTLHSGIPEVVLDRRSGFLVPERDIAALTDRLLRLVRDPGLRASFGRTGREHVKRRFDQALVGPRLHELYRELVANQRS